MLLKKLTTVLKPCGFDGRNACKALNQVEKNKVHQAESQQTSGVLGPALLRFFLYADQLVSERLYWPQNRVKKRPAAFEQLRKGPAREGTLLPGIHSRRPS